MSTENQASEQARPASPSRRSPWWFLAGLAVALLLWLGWALIAPERDARAFLRQVSALQVGHTPYSQVMALVNQYPGQSACYEEDCAVQFENVWLHRLHLAPVTEFHVVLRRGQGTLAGISLAMMVVGPSVAAPPRASAMVFERFGASPAGAWHAVVTSDASGRPVKTFVEITPQASPQQRRQAFDFNLRCLTKWGGCSSSRDLLPGVWQQAQKVQWVE